MTAIWESEARKISFPYFSVSGDFYKDSLILANDIDSFALSIKSFRVPLKQSIKEVIIPSIKLNFQKEGRPRWASLSDATVRIRGSAHPILQRTGKLKKASTQLNIWKIDTDSAAIVGLDSKVKYAKYHQGGTSKMSARPFVEIQLKDEQDIENIFYKWLVERSIRKGKFR